MIEQTFVLKINKASQMTVPVAMKKVLGIKGEGNVIARVTKDGQLMLAREESVDEIRERVWNEASPIEKRKIKIRSEMINNMFPSINEKIEAEKNWRDMPWVQKEMKKEVKRARSKY